MRADRSVRGRRQPAVSARALRLARGPGQSKPDASATSELTVDANAAAMRFDDAFCNRQAEPHARRVRIRPHTIETFEQACLLLPRDAATLILDAYPHHVRLRAD